MTSVSTVEHLADSFQGLPDAQVIVKSEYMIPNSKVPQAAGSKNRFCFCKNNKRTIINTGTHKLCSLSQAVTVPGPGPFHDSCAACIIGV
jgi:hypothetical protein